MALLRTVYLLSYVCVCFQFKNLPLYLEWAPMEVFKETPVVEVAYEEKTEQTEQAVIEDQSSEVTDMKVVQESEENKQVSTSCSIL